MNLPPVPGGNPAPPPPISPTAPPPVPAATGNPYVDDISHWDAAARAPFLQHRLTHFDTAGAVVLGIITLNVFAVIYHGLKFSRLPRVRADDFTAGRAIGFLFIPFFNFHWIFVYWTRLAQRMNFQFKLRNLPPPVSAGLGIAVAILTILSILPGLGIATAAVNWLILVPILSAQIQSAANQLAYWGAAAGTVPNPGTAPVGSVPPPISPLAPLPPPPPLPAPMSAAARRRWRIAGVAGGAVLLTLIVLAVKLSPPDEAAISAFLKEELSPDGVTIDRVWIERREVQGRARIYHLNIQGRRPKSTYYQPANEYDLATDHRQIWTQRQELHRLLQGPDGPRLRTLAGLAAADDADINAHLLREQVQTQDNFWNHRAQVLATRTGFTWELVYDSTSTLGGGITDPQPLDRFAGKRYVVNQPSAPADLADYARRLGEIRERVGRAARQLTVERRNAVLSMFRAGGFFLGPATNDHGIREKRTEVYLEITEARLDEEPPRLTALIRNDGGWDDSRLFSGELVHDEASGQLRLRLRSPRSEQVDGAGPLLDHDPSEFYLPDFGDGLRLELDIVNGTLQWSEHVSRLRLEPGTGANSRDSVQARLTARRQALVEATRPGRLYTGTITNRRTGKGRPWLLQFEGQESESATSQNLRATLESREGGPAFKLTGLSESNRHRSPGAPIRLDLQAGIDEIPEEFQREDDNLDVSDDRADLTLTPDGDRLVGETPRLLFRFEPAPPVLAEERRRAFEEKQRADEDAVLRHVRTGADYEGVIPGYSRSNGAVLLQFTKVENRGAVVEIELRMKDQTEAFSRATGRLLTADRRVELRRTERNDRSLYTGGLDSRSRMAAQFWLSRSDHELHLLVEADKLVLKPRERDDPRLEFPLKP